MQIKTLKLQEMLGKAVKGVGANKQIPITELIALKLENGVFTITSTDNDNYLYISESVEGDDFYAVVFADQFPKLVARTTSEYINMTVEGNHLKIVGNGEHTVPVRLDDETGEMLTYPNPVNNFPKDHKIGTIGVTTIKTILSAIKPAVDVKGDFPQYMHFYVGDSVMATDTYAIGWLDAKVLTEPKLISVAMMELVDVLASDTDVVVYASNGKLLFEGKSGLVYGPEMQGIENYQISSILGYIQKSYPSKCVLPKLEILQLLDRLSLFVGEFDDGIVSIAFSEEGVTIASQQSDSVEIVPYNSCEDFAESNGMVYIEMLRSQIKAQTGDTIEMYFGDGKSLKLVDNASKVTSVVCMVEA